MANPSSSDSPKLVSIICRSIGRQELEKALSSVASQSYPAIELVLVDAAANGLDDYLQFCGDTRVKQVATGKKLPRSAAANAGLDAAGGDYLMFLDDDDWIAADHVEKLVSFLQSQDEVDAVYSSTRRVNSAGKEQDYLFDDDFDRFLLMRDNFIPIHAMLFSRSLLEKGCRFDESFDLYEDWDFWLQLNQHTQFRHLDAVTAFYRESGESGIDENKIAARHDASGPLGEARAKVFDKWLKLWPGTDFNALIGEIDNTVVIANLAQQVKELNSALKAENSAKEEKERLLIARDKLLEENQDKLNHATIRVADLEKYVANLLGQIEEFKTDFLSREELQKSHIKRLEDQLNEIYASGSWKLSKPLRVAGRVLKGQPLHSHKQPTEEDNEDPSDKS